MSILDRAASIRSDIVAVRRDLHRHPELKFEERRTAAVVAAHLQRLGIPHRVGVAKTGVVGELGNAGPTVALRADMDALPIEEKNDTDYRSENKGIMHACGHDAHVACLMGAATLLADDFKAGRLKGRVRFLFQPSEEGKDEEGKSGGERMVDEGALQGVAGVIGMHVISNLESGTVFLREGAMMAAADRFEARILGRGGHGALPHLALDPIWLAAQAVLAIQGVVARRKHPMQAGLITVGSIHGGTTSNVIPAEVEMTGTIRSLSQETRELLHRELVNALAVVRAFGGDYQLNIQPGYPVTMNDPQMTRFLQRAAAGLIGEQRVKESVLEAGAEDFSFMAQAAPGVFFFLGAKKDHIDRNHHAPNFDIDEGVLPTGAALMAEAGRKFLEEHA